MVLTERYKRLDADTLQMDMTLTDPKTYTAPWVGDTIKFERVKVAIFEEVCAPSEENHFKRSHQGCRCRNSQTLASIYLPLQGLGAIWARVARPAPRPVCAVPR